MFVVEGVLLGRHSVATVRLEVHRRQALWRPTETPLALSLFQRGDEARALDGIVIGSLPERGAFGVSGGRRQSTEKFLGQQGQSLSIAKLIRIEWLNFEGSGKENQLVEDLGLKLSSPVWAIRSTRTHVLTGGGNPQSFLFFRNIIVHSIYFSKIQCGIWNP